MKGKLRKVTSILVMLCMLLSLMPMNVIALEGEQSVQTTTNGAYADKTWSAGGDGRADYNLKDGTPIQLYKTAEAVEGMENTFDVTLKVVTSVESSVQTNSGAVVLVIDVSNSMRYCAECGADGKHKNDCKHYNRRDNSVKDNQKRIYAAREAAKDFLANYAGTDASATRMISVVTFGTRSSVHSDWLNVAGGPGKNSYNTVLNKISSVAISSNVYDGGTNLEAGLYDAKINLQDSDVKNITSRNVVVLTDGKPTYDRTLSGSGTGGSATFNSAAKNQATQIKKAGAVIYTVMYGDATEKTYGNGPTVGDFLSGSIASSADKAYNAENSTQLYNAFKAISETISSGCDGAGWTATDPMANMIGVVSAGTPANFTTGDGNTYTWALTTPETSKVGGVTYYTYSCTYRITLDVQAKGFVEDKFYPANEKTFLNTEEGKFEFPVPGVKGFLPRTDVSVTKAWNDGNNQDGKRTDSVVVQLLKDGATYGDAVVLSGSNDWSHKWANLIKKSGGVTHDYTIKEVNVPEGYTPSYSKQDNKIILTNNHTPEVIGFGVEKAWNDNDNQDGIRPGSVTVNLLADGKKVADKTLTLNKENNWKGNFNNLPKFKEGVEIVYTISEASVDGYTAQVTGTVAEGFTITNSHDPEVTKVDVTKVWKDADNQDGKRTDDVTVQLYADGEEVAGKTLTLNEGNKWNGTFNNLPKNNKGTAIEYTVKEVNVADGYTAEVTGTMATGFTVTNTHTPEKINIPVTKAWVDADNQDGKRPGEITVKLLADGKEVATKVLNAEGKWAGSFNDMPKYAKGKVIEYTVKEAKVDGYTSVVTGNANDGFTVTNTHNPEKISIPVTKDWVDNKNQDGIRPDSITVKLLADGKEVGSKVLNAENKWTENFKDMPKFAKGKEISYSVEEVNVKGYTSVVTGDAETGFTVTNTHTPEVTSVKVTKEWVDNDNQDGKRATLVFVQLYANGELADVDALVLSEENHWTGSFTNLDKNSNGKAIVYTVKEAMVADGYTVAITGDAENGYTITNTHTPEQINIPVTKVWKDNNNQDGIQPGEITVKLLADGKEVASKVLSQDNNWTDNFAKLDKYKDGKEIAYTVKEVSVKGYQSVVTGTMAAGFTITNTHETEKTSVDVTKVWEDNDDQDGIQPDEITVKLLADGKANGKTLVLNDKNDWTGTFENLDKFKAGKEITYTVEEVSVEGYQSVVTGTMATGFIITNTHQVEKTSVDVTKVWKDNDDQDGIQPDEITVKLLADGKANGKTLVLNEKNDWTGTFDNLDKKNAGKEIAYTVEEVSVKGYKSVVTGTMAAGFVITNTHETEKTSVDVTKVWVDNDDQDGIQPGEITVKLLADGKANGKTLVLNDKNDWTGTFENLDKFKAGKEITYTVEEVKVDDYTSVVTGNAETGFTVTNTHTPEQISIPVTKTWKDEDNQDGKRTDSVTVKLLADGKEVGSKVLNEKNHWTGTFENLDKFKAGKEITYTVEEVAVDGYSVSVTGSVEDGFVVTNTHTPEQINVPVTKKWNDKDNQDGKRADAVTVKLFADGKEVGTKVLNEKNHWTDNFTDLAKYREGKVGEEIVYTVEELAVDSYRASVDGSVEDGFVVTNTHTPEQIDIPVTKVWDDEDNQDGKRTESVTVKLLADGVAVEGETLVLNEKNHWTGNFTDLTKYREGEVGQLIQYTVKEVAVDGYSVSVSGSVKDGLVVTNTHTPEQINIPVTKVWDDADNQDGVRAESVTVKLLADGEEVASKVLNEKNHWTDNFTGLTKYREGKVGEEIVYTVEEVAVDGYRATVEGSVANGFVVTNTHAPEQIDIPVTKVWDDADNQDGIRARSVTVQLYADGDAVEGKTVTLSKDNDWKASFTGLTKYRAGEVGQLIQYTVKEVNVADGYQAEVTGSVANGFVVTNTHTPEQINIPVTKVWDDEDNQDGIRASSVTVQLYADGDAVEGKTVALSKDNDWKASFTGLAKYRAGEVGQLIQYTVKEVNVADGYQAEVTGSVANGFVVTNTHTPEQINIPVTKVWDDADNQDGVRAESVTVKLLADGEEVASKVLNEKNHWTDNFTGLTKYREGKVGEEIVYKVEEVAVDGYRATVEGSVANGFVVTNTHAPEQISIPVSKVWNDADNQDGVRTESVTVKLLADGKEVASKVLNKENNWTASFTDLDKFKAGKEIVYTVVEDAVEGYTATVEGSVANGFVVTNTHAPEQINIPVTKVWDDADNQDGVRAESVTVKLLADGEEVASKVLNEENNWAENFADLDKFKAGKEIVYTVEEEAVEGYTATVEGSVARGFVVTNTHAPEQINIPISKVWDDADNQDGIRAESVTVKLLADGEEVASKVLNEENNWAENFADLDKFKAGKEIVYTVEEEAVEGYTATVEGSVANGFVVTNTHAPELISIPVVKVWNDLNDRDGSRPDSVTIRLYANGEALENGVLVLNKDNYWKGIFNDLPKFSQGEEIVYTISEDAVAKYRTAITGSAEEGFMVTNSHTPLPGDFNLEDPDPGNPNRPLPSDKNLPDTGDDSDQVLLFNVALLSISALAALKLRRRKEDEE